MSATGTTNPQGSGTSEDGRGPGRHGRLPGPRRRRRAVHRDVSPGETGMRFGTIGVLARHPINVIPSLRGISGILWRRKSEIPHFVRNDKDMY